MSRLAQLVAALALLATPSRAFAQAVVEADLRGGVYQDSDATTIVTSAASVTGRPHENLSISGRYLADIVTSASVDVVSAATGRWDEVRHEGLGGIGYEDADRSASASYIYSVENDWRSHTGAISLAHDTFDHQLTIGVSGSFVYNEVGRSGDANFDKRLLVGNGNAEVTIVATKFDLVSFIYSLGYATGYQASPYRYVRFDGPLAGAEIALPERHPDERGRHALAAGWNHYIAPDMVLRANGRAYADDWGVLSGTLGVDYVIGIQAFELSVLSRSYFQRAATFYREHYASELTSMTADRELSTFADFTGGARIGFEVLDAGPFLSLRGDLTGKAFYYKFFDFAPLPERYGFIAEIGLGASL